jgi:hypothetical protein
MSSINIRRLDMFIRIEYGCSLGIMFGAKAVRLALHLTKTSAPKLPLSLVPNDHKGWGVHSLIVLHVGLTIVPVAFSSLNLTLLYF